MIVYEAKELFNRLCLFVIQSGERSNAKAAVMYNA